MTIIAPRGQRLIALVGLEGGAVSRGVIAETLWPEQRPARRMANLRGTLFRLPPRLRTTLRADGHVALGPTWTVDHTEALRMIGGHDADLTIGDPDSPSHMLTQRLLPDFDDDWLVVPRQQFEDRRLRALESLAERAREAGRSRGALAAAEAALVASPLRETAARLVVQLHLDQGNVADAIGAAERFTDDLRRTHGIAPTEAFRHLIDLDDAQPSRDATATDK